jgi:hypothetical protein
MTPWWRVYLVSLQRRVVGQEIPVFSKTASVMAVLTKVGHWILSWACWIQTLPKIPFFYYSFQYYPPINSRVSQVTSFVRFPTNIFYRFLSSSMHATCPMHFNLLNLIAALIWCGCTNLRCFFAIFPRWQTGFDLSSGHIGQSGIGAGFLPKYLGFPCQFTFHQLLHILYIKLYFPSNTTIYQLTHISLCIIELIGRKMSLHVSAHETILRRYINNLLLLNYAFYMDQYISLAFLWSPLYAQIVFYTTSNMY